MQSALVASTLLLAGNLPTVMAQSETAQGCFSSSKPLEDQGAYMYQSNGYCLNLCYENDYSVFALYDGDHCLCGNTLPAESSKVDDGQCNKECAAWPVVMCGGSDAYSVYLTGLKEKVPYYSSSSTTTTGGDSSTSTGTGHASTATQTTPFATSEGETQAANQQDKKSGPNTAAIAAGVVVGVVGLCALIGAGFFLWRFKTRHPADQRLREVNNIERFGGNKPMSQSSMSDSRFDPDFMAQRRQSNGSIDDDQDFSRRILQVTNPDRS